MLIEKISSGESDFAGRLDRFIASSARPPSDLVFKVREIIDNVRLSGDDALLRYAREFDGYDGADSDGFRVPGKDIKDCLGKLNPELREALSVAAKRIRSFAKMQRISSWEIEDEEGNRVGQRAQPLRAVGLYVPGGEASYPSTLLMAALPAQEAGVERIVVATPPQNERGFSVLLAAAAICGVNEIYCVGGAHAIAALTYGTESVPRVDKIVGPGNCYVTEAKRQLFGSVGIDMLAGPSEVVVICDSASDPEWVAADLCSQAEHDAKARAILITPDGAMANRVLDAMRELIERMPRAKIIEESLRHSGLIITVGSLAEAAEIANRLAPEHVELYLEEPLAVIDSIRNAGAIFLGKYSPVVLGDYCAGPNHVLPTSGTARFASPLGAYDFQKRSNIINCSRVGSAMLARHASVIAKQEGLRAHSEAAECRAQMND